jgi:hypothetical protein
MAKCTWFFLTAEGPAGLLVAEDARFFERHMKPAFLLARVSTWKQSQDQSPDRQIENLRTYCERQAWKVAYEDTDRASGNEGGSRASGPSARLDTREEGRDRRDLCDQIGSAWPFPAKFDRHSRRTAPAWCRSRSFGYEYRHNDAGREIHVSDHCGVRGVSTRSVRGSSSGRPSASQGGGENTARGHRNPCNRPRSRKSSGFGPRGIAGS